MKSYQMFLILSTTLLIGQAVQAGAVDDLLKRYQAEGASTFSASRGDALWHKTFVDPKSKDTRSCTKCHTENLKNTGKHARTGKAIKPMAPSVNSKRLTDAKFIEKWFRRNCKWTIGRECTAQEKGDILMFLRTQ